MHPNAEAHRAAGRLISTAAGELFVLEDGDGPAVLLLHGVPVSSYVYRKVVPLLGANGLRAVAPDFPGMGLSSRPDPSAFDYSYGGLSAAVEACADALGLERFHLVVHDIGGPVGFDLVARVPERIASLLVLNTFLDLDQYRSPWVLRPYQMPVLDRISLAAMRPALAYPLFLRLGVADHRQFTMGDAAANLDLLRHEDGGRAFLAIMRSMDRAAARRRELEEALARAPFPSAVLWGRHDPVLGAARAAHVANVLGCGEPTYVEAKHFLQEDQAPLVAEAVLRLAHHPPA